MDTMNKPILLENLFFVETDKKNRGNFIIEDLKFTVFSMKIQFYFFKKDISNQGSKCLSKKVNKS